MIGVLGSGSWATAIVKILTENSKETIHWWVREEQIIHGLTNDGNNPLYLSEIFFDTSRLAVSNDINEVVDSCDDLFLVIPSAFVASALKSVPKEKWANKRIHSAVKGIEPASNLIVTDYLEQMLGIAPEQMSVISGPSHAEETARKKLTFLTVGSVNPDLVEQVRNIIEGKFVRTTPSADMRGIEYSTVMKNIYAVAAGICRGLGHGDNLIAVLIANAAQEMEHFLQECVPAAGRRLSDYVYLGDLLVTCYSQHSRNRTFGNMIGMGYNVKEAQMEMKMIAEGYYAVACVEKIRKAKQIEMPIEETVYSILYRRSLPSDAIDKLLKRLK